MIGAMRATTHAEILSSTAICSRPPYCAGLGRRSVMRLSSEVFVRAMKRSSEVKRKGSRGARERRFKQKFLLPFAIAKREK